MSDSIYLAVAVIAGALVGIAVQLSHIEKAIRDLKQYDYDQE